MEKKKHIPRWDFGKEAWLFRRGHNTAKKTEGEMPDW